MQIAFYTRDRRPSIDKEYEKMRAKDTHKHTCTRTHMGMHA